MSFSLTHQWSELQQKVWKLWESKLAPRYDALDEREQKTVRIAAVILPIILFIFGIALPILDKNNALKEEVISLSTQVQEAKNLAQVLSVNPVQQNKAGITDNILTRVDKIARQTDVRSFMTRLRPQQVMGNKQRVQTQIKDVPYRKLTAFLSAIETHHLSISQLKIQATSAVGYVHVQAVIGG
ncbi:MAG: type II secretion system protein GspM [Ghiorsea sp.]